MISGVNSQAKTFEARWTLKRKISVESNKDLLLNLHILLRQNENLDERILSTSRNIYSK